MKKPVEVEKHSTIDAALKGAMSVSGNTVLALVSPRQAERLLLALEIADGVVLAESVNHSTGIKHKLWKRYKALSRKDGV